MMMTCTTAGSIASASAKLWELFSLYWLSSAASTPSSRLTAVQMRKAFIVISVPVMIELSIVFYLLPEAPVSGCLAHQGFVIGSVFGKGRGKNPVFT